jgi:quinol monooxygenase YgiN
MATIGCTVVAYLRARPGRRAELRRVLEGFVAPTRAEEGCVDYHLHISDDDPDLFVFYENWRSKRDLDEHLAKPHLTPLRERGRELLAGEPEIRLVTMLSPYGR